MNVRAREEGQRETDSLRVYVGSVEAAAAGLLSRVQELEHLLALCTLSTPACMNTPSLQFFIQFECVTCKLVENQN